MSVPLIGFALAILLTVSTSLASAQGLEKVEYVADSIMDADNGVLRLLGGSTWLMAGWASALVGEDVMIVIRQIDVAGKPTKLATAYVDGDDVAVRHLKGLYVSSTGYLTTVVEAIGNGAVLKLADGTLLSVPDYDRFDTSWWLPPYKAILTTNELYLYNLEEAKKVWVKRLR